MIDSAYRLHSAVTDPGPYAGLLQSLPVDVEELVPLIGNVLVHHSRAEGFVAGAGRADDGTELRPIRHVLAAIAALEDGPWSRTRPAGRRLVVDCRTFAVLLAAVLREHGIPARVRFGFAGYLEPSHWQSHVVCEHAQDGV
ncbi:transglutaminase-like domain-containing protein [Leifsonia sp. F6_8S_P_1B]|uniref:Transglutaminase-like domain-containing protein n=1 Tax=Leifsonia williamsii TaxID=3035919 RepID=A0ABT8K9H2_9MICO|nr:transglutaminase-like domain-containing protein [Leifsonia williamsii]MDN4614109.1 transglutaminase-like domain-containing protein [Leifsonia williamsii]